MSISQQLITYDYHVPLVATPTVRATGAASSGATAVTPGLPTGHTTNDILLCFVQSSNEVIATPTNATSGTWVQVTNSPQGIGTAATAGSVRLAVFWMRDAGATIGTVTVADSGNHTIAFISAFIGCKTSGDPWNITGGQTETGTSARVTFPGVTTTVGNCLIIPVVGHAIDSNTASYSSTVSLGNTDGDSGVLGHLGSTSTNTGTGGGFAAMWTPKAASGSTGSVQLDMTGSSSNYAEVVVALTSN